MEKRQEIKNLQGERDGKKTVVRKNQIKEQGITGCNQGKRGAGPFSFAI